MAATFKLEVVETKRSLWAKYLWILYVLWLLLGIWICYDDGFKKNWLKQLPGPCIFLLLLIDTHFFSDKYKKNFLSIDDDSICWKFKQMMHITKIPWIEVKWIKLEQKGISFYAQSSFKIFLPTDDTLTQEQKEKLTTTITEIASEKNIKIVS
jgi:hypothetical protein